MYSIILLLTFVLHGQAEGVFDNKEVVEGLMSSDRSVRKAAVQKAEQLSKKELIALARNTVDDENLRLKQPDVIYTFLRILSIAQQKGFCVDDAMTLFESPEASKYFRTAILDWLNEVGKKSISGTDAVDLVPKFDRIFADQQEDLVVRLHAYRVARGLIGKIHHKLKSPQKEAADETREAKTAKIIRDHITQVCNVVANVAESDKAVDSFAGYVPYYCIYLRDGLVEKNTLQSCLEQALQDKNRSDECKNKLQKMLMRLNESIEWADKMEKK